MGYDVVHAGDLEWEERPGHEGPEPRQAASVTDPAHMTESRARMWRYPPTRAAGGTAIGIRRRSSPRFAAR